MDLAGTLAAAKDHGHPTQARIVSCTTDAALHNGWAKDSFGREPVDLTVPADPDLLVRALLDSGEPIKPNEWALPAPAPTASHWADGPDIFMHDLARPCGTPSATNPPAWSASRSAGAAPTSRPPIRWTTWAWTAAPASARAPAWRSAPRWPWRAAAACRSRSSATATS